MARSTGSVVPASVMRAVVRRLVRPVLGPDVPVGRQRRRVNALMKVARLPRGTRVNRVVLGGRPAERITTPGTDRGRAVLYLHGGGYTVCSLTTHRALAAHLAAAAGAPVHLLDYRLAPEHPYPAAVDDAEAAYRALLGTGIDPRQISVAGDSAGGGLSLALMIRLRAAGVPLPGSAALISPWTDLTLDGVQDDPQDPMLRTAWLRANAARYAPAADLRAPELSPLFADLAGLPPMLVHAASDEILLNSVERFVARARAAGASVDFRRLDGLWHVVHLHAGLVAPATSAVHEIGDFLRETTSQPASKEDPDVQKQH